MTDFAPASPEFSSSERLPIGQVDCDLLDAVLALGFEPRELENLASRAGLARGTCLCSPSRDLVSTIHRACHVEGPFPAHLQRLLDCLHRRELERLDGEGFDAYASELVGSDLWSIPALPGRLWAVGTSAHPQAPVLRRYLVRSLQLDGLRALRSAAEQRAG